MNTDKMREAIRLAALAATHESASVTAASRPVRVQHRGRFVGRISIGDDYASYLTERIKSERGRRRLTHSEFTEEHRAYLQTSKWRQIRELAIEDAGRKCSSCGRGGRLEVHHKTYRRWRKEKMKDLVVMCHGCHLAEHRERRRQASLKAGRTR